MHAQGQHSIARSGTTADLGMFEAGELFFGETAAVPAGVATLITRISAG